MNPASLPPVRVLLAEDDTISRMVVGRMAETLGCTCTQVGNGREALEALEATKVCPSGTYDLLLLDIEMPEMDGIEAAQAVKAHFDAHPPAGGKRPRVVALTGDLCETKLREYHRAGFDECLGKPLKIERLQALLDALPRVVPAE
ncbi:CheY chemotaxis protein or a CheY-like REC (receiver) domain [Verrucomicrobium sp. GAS474]|uniref:response regulator n=1 Tax=Verrucomicrobium sp. GAS474 TaxID=1882831 RepID=UPI00087B322A|nr:response regulator [Verrucomicrobium sp. GAS474]SDU04547.1 CheY chemotaxis protein or a CheY-like REC (receiver) domain [Verrucomicrobium sp. GAS474]